MAGVSTKDIKKRIRSMENTRQITKAMEMVATSKLRQTQNQVYASRPYFEILYQTIFDITAFNHEFRSPFLRKRAGKKPLYIVVAGDRGLAGGYNGNVLKLSMQEMEGKDAIVLPIGRKALDYFRAHNVPIYTDNYALAAAMTIGDCFSLSKIIAKAFLDKEIDEVWIVYTNFVSVLSQVPGKIKVLPLDGISSGATLPSRTVMDYEPSVEEVFAAVVPECLGGFLYSAICESRCSEQAARRAAMDSATQNAEEMIADLSLKYNRARQSAITQEITEIIAGAEA